MVRLLIAVAIYVALLYGHPYYTGMPALPQG